MMGYTIRDYGWIGMATVELIQRLKPAVTRDA
jgi:hypothetical protein